MMTYFNNITSFGELKKQYRILAIANHPDKGGGTAVMQQINQEFGKLFKIWEHKKPTSTTSSGYENDYTGATASQYSQSVYNEYRWRGTNYKGQSRSEILDITRKWLKETYPRYKFSVRKNDYSSIYISLLSADFEVFINKERTSHSLNQYHIEKDQELTEHGREVMKNVFSFIMSYNYDNSDAMTDYFDTNFYLNLSIGTYKHPYKVETPKLTCAKSKLPPAFKHPEGAAHKAVRQALGKALFSFYNTGRYGRIMVLGETHYGSTGEETFYPLQYSAPKTAQKRIDKLTAAGIRCKLTGGMYGYIQFEGYTPETEQAMIREREEYASAKKAWDEKQSTPKVTKQVDSPKENEIRLIDYSEKSIAVIGNTKPVKDTLNQLGGKFNKHLSCGAGWVFPKTKIETVKQALSITE